MNAKRARTVPAFFPSLALAALASCTVEVDDPAPVVPAFHEREPNDAPAFANPIGPFAVGESLRIRGHVTDFGADVFDGFAFASVEPCDVSFVLWNDNPHADLDLCVYDPMLGQYAFCFETSASPEVGTFHVPAGGMEFHFVVSSFAGSSGYSLDVYFDPISFPATASESPALGLDRASRAAIDGRIGRKVPIEQYFRASGADASPEPQVFARGRMLQIDLEDGREGLAEFLLTDRGYHSRFATAPRSGG